MTKNSFLSVLADSNSPARCVDGRMDPSSSLGPQMLGGSLHPTLLAALFENSKLSEQFVKEKLEKLQAEYPIGVHRGSHASIEDKKSDCGFADRMLEILSVAIDKRDIILERLFNIYNEYSTEIPFKKEEFERGLVTTFERIERYSVEDIMITGEELVGFCEECGANVEKVEEEHNEEVAFVNLSQGTTFDTIYANKEGWQAFNLDVWSCIAQAKHIGVEEHFALFTSLILYVATEIVLVEQKGKEALPVKLNFS